MDVSRVEPAAIIRRGKNMILTETWLPRTPPLRVDEGGAIRVGDSRVTLEVLLAEYKLGATAEEIADAYDTVGLANVHAVLSYYLNNREVVDAYLCEVEKNADELKRQAQAQPEYGELVAKLRQRQQERQDQTA